MFFIFSFFYIFFFLLLFLILCYILSFRFTSNFDVKSSPFECGFSRFSTLKEFFSVPFFLISLMFLLFDVEILLLCLYPLVPFSLFFRLMNFLVITTVFLSTLYE